MGADRTVLQVDKPNQLLVLKTDDGQPTSRTPLEENERLERVPMPVDEDSVLLVTDLRTVKKFDFNHGQTVWVYQESPVLPVNGDTPLFGDCECLLVLHDGRLLIRLDPATGSKRWSSMLGAQDLSERPGAMAYDQTAVLLCEYGKYLWNATPSTPGPVTRGRLFRVVTPVIRTVGKPERSE